MRIGFQKYGKLVLLKSKGTLEEKLKPLGYKVAWTEFPSGPPLLEAINVGAIDFGNTGEAPPIFAQAAGAPLRLCRAMSRRRRRARRSWCRRTARCKTVADLKGKKVALNKGSNVHYLLVKALEKAGVKYSEIEPVFLAPADARAAFERGAVDAWVIWDPFQAAAEVATGARTLADGTGVVANHQFYLASRKFSRERRKGDRRRAEGTRRGRRLGAERHQGGRRTAQPVDRHSGAGPRARAEAAELRHQAARRAGHRRAAAHRRHLLRAEAAAEARSRSPTPSESPAHEQHADIEHGEHPLVPADPRRRPLSRHDQRRAAGRSRLSAPDRAGRRRTRLFRRAAADRAKLRGFLDRRLGAGAADAAAALPRRGAARVCSRRASRRG